MRTRLPDRAGVTIVAAALLAAPFLAWLYSPAAGLVVMAIALMAAAYLLIQVQNSAPPALRRAVRVVLGFDIILVLTCLFAAAWWVISG